MLRPLEDKIIVKVQEEAEKTSASGLIIQTLEKEKPQEAVVVAVGPGIRFGNGDMMKPDLNVGDKVVFAKYQGTEIKHDNEDYIILAYRDVIAVIND